jgi:hypothetical protein
MVTRDIADGLVPHVSPGAKKADPGLRLASLLVGDAEPQKALKYLKAIIADAEAAGLPAVAARARELQNEIESESFHHPFGTFEDEDDDWDEDDDIWEDEDDDALSAEECMDALARAVATGDAAAVTQIRDALIGMGVNRTMIDTAIKILTEAKGTTRSRKTAKAKKTGGDSRQIDLF